MNILIIAHFTIRKNEVGNNRFNYLADVLADRGHQIELITSSFNHTKKVQRKRRNIQDEPYEEILIYEPGYQKNVSVKRIFSHKKMADNLRKYLDNKKERPDLVYCAVPSLHVAQVAGEYAKKNHIRFVIDVQDLWPEAFQMVFHMPVISSLLFYPIRKKADKIYQKADEIIAVSDTYGKRAARVNKKCKGWTSCYLGTDLEYFDSCKEGEREEDGVFRIAYIGTLGHSYDIKSVIKAIHYLNRRGINNIEFLVMGEGPLRKEFEDYAKQLKVNAVFTGILEYSQMVARLCRCDAAVNPISHGAAQSIINKVGDYAAAGLPVINTQECEEYRNLIERYQCGINCENGNMKSVVNAIYTLYKDTEKRKSQGKRSRELAQRLFNRKVTYEKILKVIEEEELNSKSSNRKVIRCLD